METRETGDERSRLASLLASAELALQQSEARRLAVLDIAVDGVVTVNASGKIDGFNRAAEHIFGWAAAEIVGESYIALIPADSLATLRLETQSGSVSLFKPMDVTATHKSGRDIHVQVTITTSEAGGERFFTCVVRDVSERKAISERLEFMALHDELTGLANRRLLVARLEEAITVAGQSGHRIALMYLDLDGFELVNDTLGHDAGDQLLATVAERIGNVIRESDTFARIEGDEFVVLCDRLTGLESLAEIRDRIAAALDQPLSYLDREVYLSAS
ncbi:MAG TPA: diguanylate cyclase, partial [Acidimicrobiales bacterium]|nr:diguanylate cyclase [Acidimicrobiales bacterium]